MSTAADAISAAAIVVGCIVVQVHGFGLFEGKVIGPLGRYFTPRRTFGVNQVVMSARPSAACRLQALWRALAGPAAAPAIAGQPPPGALSCVCPGAGTRGAGAAGAKGGGSGCGLSQCMSLGVFGGQGNCGKGPAWAPTPASPKPTASMAVAAAQRAELRMLLLTPDEPPSSGGLRGCDAHHIVSLCAGPFLIAGQDADLLTWTACSAVAVTTAGSWRYQP
jgi:hypothetical protein